MRSITLTTEEFIDFLRASSLDDDDTPTATITPEAALLSRAITIAVTDQDAGTILHCLHSAKALDIPVRLEPECQTLLLKFMNSTN